MGHLKPLLQTKISPQGIIETYSTSNKLHWAETRSHTHQHKHTYTQKWIGDFSQWQKKLGFDGNEVVGISVCHECYVMLCYVIYSLVKVNS